MSETKTAFKPGDVVRYETLTMPSRHCREGQAIAEEWKGRIVLLDTFWGSSDRHVLTDDEIDTAELVFNLKGYDELDRYSHESPAKWKRFKPVDRETVTSQHGLQIRWFVRKGATPDLQTQIENACEEYLNAQSKLRSAEENVTRAWQTLQGLETDR